MPNDGLEISIRRVRRTDAAAWLSLRRMLWPLPATVHRADIKKLFGKRGFLGLLAWNGDEAVGFAEATIRPFANGCEWQPVPFLEGLFVKRGYRRKRIGRQLVASVESWAIKKGFRELGSDAYLSAEVSHRAHRSYGFKETERVVYFRKGLRK